LADNRIIASVHSATGSAFAYAGDDTTTPRAYTSGVTTDLTDPAVWTTARSRGAIARTSASTRRESHPVTRISASANVFRVLSVSPE
jgi:hypothetical protein